MTERGRRIAWLGLSLLVAVAIARAAGLPSEALELPQGARLEPAVAEALASAIDRASEPSASEAAVWQLACLYHANELPAAADALYAWLLSVASSGEQRARLHYLRAHLAMEKGDQETAMERFRDSAEAFDGYALTHVWLGEARLKEGDPAGAETRFRAALALDASLSPARLGLARALEKSGREREAAELLESLVASDPFNYNAKALLSQLLARRGEGERSAALRRDMENSSAPPVSDPWLQPVLDAALSFQRLDMRFLDHFLTGDFARAERYLQRMEKVAPENPQVCRYRGLLQSERGELEAATQSFRAGVELGGEAGVFYPLWIRVLNRRGMPEEAESVARKGLEAAPEQAEMLALFGELLFERGALEEALHCLERSVKADPYNLEARLLHARAATWAKQATEAEASFQMIQQLAYSDPQMLARAALIRLESKQYAEAVPLLERALAVSPEHAGARELLADAYCELGKAAQQGSDLDEAARRFDQALALRPAHLAALSGKARALVDARRFDLAEPALAALLRETGDEPALLTAFGDVLLANGKFIAARVSWEKALELTRSGGGSLRREKALLQRLDGR